MTNTVQKITLSCARDIPFDKLSLSHSNVRRIKAGISIEELAEDIARRGLLQSLSVRPLLDADGVPTGRYEIPAGGRRYRALELLVKQKRLARTAPVPCVVRDGETEILAEDDSLAENLQRASLHPLDQFRAFQALREKGRSEEEIAAAFFLPVSVVKQRLRLASVSRKLLDVYAEDAMTLDQLMAFTVTPDHARQEQVWEAIANAWSKQPYQIRRMLTEKTVSACDRRALFVGADAYEAAGGTILRDLFAEDEGGWFADPALLDRLVSDKLKAAAAAIGKEGWKWIEVAADFPYGHTTGLRKLEALSSGRTPEEQASIDALRAEYHRLESEHAGAEELPDEVDARLGEIEERLERLEAGSVAYDTAEKARAGVFVHVGPEGRLVVDRGYVRRDDEEPIRSALGSTGAGDGERPATEGENDGRAPVSASPSAAVVSVAGQAPDTAEDEDDPLKPLPERLLMELTAHRTLALRDALAGNPQVALTALLFKLVGDTFPCAATAGGCLEASVRHVMLPAQGPDLQSSASARAIAARRAAWEADIPREDEALWTWLTGLDDASRLALLAHCVSYGVNALHEKPNPYGGSGISRHGLHRRFVLADRLAHATGLDMVEAGWRPSVDNYLGRVPKRRILEAVREGAGERSAEMIAHLKKGDMAREAERLLAQTGWLPEVLRGAATDAEMNPSLPQPGQVETPEGTEELPSFLSADDEGDDEPTAEEDAGPFLAAAE